MQPIRVKVCQESDLRMLGLLARNIQRVLPVTQADIDAAAALGKGWVVWKVIEVSDPLDNLRGGTQLIIKQNSITPGQNVRRVIFVSGPGGETVVIGPAPSPLLLPDAIANSLHYVKAFGGTELSGTPTPDTPVDIVCNNGILKVKDSELPVGYKRLTGISYDTDIYYETNQKLYGSDTLTITLSNTSNSGRNVIGAYSGTGSDARNFSLFIYGANSTSNSYLRHGTKLGRPRFGTGTRTLVMGPTGTDGFLTDVTYDAEDFETTDTFWIGGLPNSSSTKYDGDIVGNITVSNRLKYIPCERVSDGKIGYYETFTDAFLEPQGTGTPVSMGYDVSYMTKIYIDSTGTVETIGIIGKNLFNKATVTEGFILTSGDAPYASTGNGYSDYIPIVPGQYYYIGQRAASTSANNDRVITYDKDKNVLQQVRYAATGAVYRVNNANARFIRFNLNLNYLNTLQFELGQTPTDYEPYTNSGTATCEPLLAVGDYTDVQSILDGVVTRNVGVKVLTGDENFETATATNCYSLTNTLGTGNFADRTIVCSHFDSTSTQPGTGDRQGLAFIVNKGPDYTIAFGATTQFSTQTQWKNWLAAQAAAGTPVIIVYPLATATTESVAGQTLQVTDGNNVLEITQASMSDLELEAEYEQGVEALVEEIEP